MTPRRDEDAYPLKTGWTIAWSPIVRSSNLREGANKKMKVIKMGLLSFLDKIFSQGYESIEDYCNQNGLNYTDLPEPDDYYDDDDDD